MTDHMDLIKRLKRFRRRGRLPRATRTVDRIITRKSDGRRYIAHHQGAAAAMAGLFSGDRDGGFWFLPVREWRGRLVAAIDYGWPARSGQFDVAKPEKPLAVTYVGRLAGESINDGGVCGR